MFGDSVEERGWLRETNLRNGGIAVAGKPRTAPARGQPPLHSTSHPLHGSIRCLRVVAEGNLSVDALTGLGTGVDAQEEDFGSTRASRSDHPFAQPELHLSGLQVCHDHH